MAVFPRVEPRRQREAVPPWAGMGHRFQGAKKRTREARVFLIAFKERMPPKKAPKLLNISRDWIQSVDWTIFPGIGAYQA